MDKTKNLSLFSLALLLGLIQSIAGLTDKESFLNCKTTNKNSPLDINLPMKYASRNMFIEPRFQPSDELQFSQEPRISQT